MSLLHMLFQKTFEGNKPKAGLPPSVDGRDLVAAKFANRPLGCPNFGEVDDGTHTRYVIWSHTPFDELATVKASG